MRPEHRCRGRWQGTLDVTIDGKRRRLYVYGRTQAVAQKKLRELVRGAEEGTIVAGSATVAAWMGTWLERKARTLKPQTLRGYQSQVRNYIDPYLGRYRLTDLRADHIETMYDAQRNRGLAEATIRQTHAILGKALIDARRKGLMRSEPMKNVDPPGTQKAKRASLTLEQAQTVLAAAGDDARWWLGLFCGMRQGEVLGLRWEDVDLERGVLTIAQTLQTGTDGKLVFGRPKSDAGSRSFPMPPWVLARMKLHWHTVGEPRDGLVFSRPDGKPIRPRDDWQAWRDLLDRATKPPLAPIPRVALHSARQSAATLMEAAGTPDRLAAQILGHSTVQITHGYQTADYERIRDTWANMGRVLELTPTKETP